MPLKNAQMWRFSPRAFGRICRDLSEASIRVTSIRSERRRQELKRFDRGASGSPAQHAPSILRLRRSYPGYSRGSPWSKPIMELGLIRPWLTTGELKGGQAWLDRSVV